MFWVGFPYLFQRFPKTSKDVQSFPKLSEAAAPKVGKPWFGVAQPPRPRNFCAAARQI